ncbi:hypothetical protein FT663_01312 [Candidozyma haemuli var. vulneris]|nr:hypothetical protein FT662_01347 [[Candida] haemuloni var. vulneris]KAF3994622.1 hypothetical protein FT663_01312 [[Candida] haemuloni var. vulneris]
MNQNRFETIYVFEEFARSSFALSKVAASVFQKLSENPLSYASHITRLCHLTETILAITEVQLAFQKSPTDLQTVTCANEQFEDVVAPEFSLEHAIICPKSLTRFSPTPGLLDIPLGCLVARYRGKRFEFRDSSASLSGTLDTPAILSDRCKVSGIGKNGNGFVSLCSRYVSPHWFTQSPLAHTVIPGMNISEILEFEIRSTVYNTKAPSPLTVSCVTVQLLELTSTSAPVSPSSSIDSLETTKSLLVKTLSTISCCEKIGDSMPFPISKTLYNCCLPDCEPTFYSERMARNYAIKLIVDLQGFETGDSKQSIETLVDVNIARASQEDLQSLLQGMTLSPHHFFPERYSYQNVHRAASFDLKRHVGSVSNLLDWPYVPLERVQTAVIHGQDFCFTTTLLECLESKVIRRTPTHLQQIRPKKHKDDASSTMHYALFKTTGKTDESRDHFWAMPVIKYENRYSVCSIPLPLWNMSGGLSQSYSFANQEKLCPLDTSFENDRKVIQLSSIIEPSFHLPLPVSGAVVHPSMKIADFLKLRLSFPFNWDNLPELYTKMFLISSTRIALFACSKKKEEKVWESTKKHGFHEAKVEGWNFKASENCKEFFMEIPSELYDFTVPWFGETYQSNDDYLNMVLRVELWLVGAELKATIGVHVPVQVSRDPIDVTELGVVPPSYAVLVEKKEEPLFGANREIDNTGFLRPALGRPDTPFPERFTEW